MLDVCVRLGQLKIVYNYGVLATQNIAVNVH